MPEFLVATDDLELPRNTSFTTICEYPYEAGALVMFRYGKRRSVGRWLPGVGGFNFILLPGDLLCFVGRVVRILGRVVVTGATRPRKKKK
jgi:hypothetical protein